MNLRSWSTTLAAAALLFGSSGCYKATFYKDPSVIKGQEHEEWTDFYVFGLVGTERIDVKRFCASDEVAQVRTGGNFGTGFVSAITIGIYTPRKIYVTCSAPGQPAGNSARLLEIDADSSGVPRRAELRSAGRRVAIIIEPESTNAWHLIQGSES